MSATDPLLEETRRVRIPRVLLYRQRSRGKGFVTREDRTRPSHRALHPYISRNADHCEQPTGLRMQHVDRYVPANTNGGWGIAAGIVLLALACIATATYVHKKTYKHPT